MKTTKDIVTKGEVVLKPGSCERLVATNKLTSYLKEFPKEEVVSLLKDFTIKSLSLNKNLFIKKDEINSISRAARVSEKTIRRTSTCFEKSKLPGYR